MDMDNAQPNLNTSDDKPSMAELAQQAAIIRQLTLRRPANQLATAIEHTPAPATNKQTRSCYISTIVNWAYISRECS